MNYHEHIELFELLAEAYNSAENGSGDGIGRAELQITAKALDVPVSEIYYLNGEELKISKTSRYNPYLDKVKDIENLYLCKKLSKNLREIGGSLESGTTMIIDNSFKFTADTLETTILNLQDKDVPQSLSELKLDSMICSSPEIIEQIYSTAIVLEDYANQLGQKIQGILSKYF